MGRMIAKRVLVTAAGQGIGRACAEMFHQEGAYVFATDINEASLATLSSAGISTQVVDGTNGPSVAACLSGVEPFDAVVHCIGRVDNGSVLDCDEAAWRNAFRVNVDSFYHVLQNVLPGMRREKSGSIVCISSVASSVMGLPNRAVYGATKAALIGLAKAVAADFVADGIRCNAVCPGTITSPSLLNRVEALDEKLGGKGMGMNAFVARQPMGRLGTPEEVAAMCLYLASAESGFVTGQTLSIDGGMTI
jgi:2-keto-3-deoxy-L-fuconate dehydrogenase